MNQTFLPQVRIAGTAYFGSTMGQTPRTQGQDIYNRAVVAVSTFDSLTRRTSMLANQVVRNDIITKYGLSEPANQDKGRYMRDIVAYHIGLVNASTGPARFLIFEQSANVNRVERLRSVNGDFEADVKSAEVYGILPEPQIITQQVAGPGADLTVPIVIGAGAVALAIILF